MSSPIVNYIERFSLKAAAEFSHFCFSNRVCPSRRSCGFAKFKVAKQISKRELEHSKREGNANVIIARASYLFCNLSYFDHLFTLILSFLEKVYQSLLLPLSLFCSTVQFFAAASTCLIGFNNGPGAVINRQQIVQARLQVLRVSGFRLVYGKAGELKLGWTSVWREWPGRQFRGSSPVSSISTAKGVFPSISPSLIKITELPPLPFSPHYRLPGMPPAKNLDPLRRRPGSKPRVAV